MPPPPPPPPSSRPRERLSTSTVLVLAALLLVAAMMRLVNIDTYTGSFDEGVRAEQLLLMAAGYQPFRDIFASQGVLLLHALYPFFLLGGQTLSGIRAGVALFSLL